MSELDLGDGVIVRVPERDTRFCEALQRVWDRLRELSPLTVQKIGEHWEKQTKSPIICRHHERINGEHLAATSRDGFFLEYFGLELDKKDLAYVEFVIAQLLAHVHAWAVVAVDMSGTDSEVSERIQTYGYETSRRWGFGQSA